MPKYSDADLERILAAENPGAQPRPRFTDEDMERILSGVPSADGPGILGRVGNVARGAVNRAGELLSGAGDAAYKISMAPGARAGRDLDSGPEVDRTVAYGAERAGLPAATDATGRALETAGEYVTDAALFAPAVASAAPSIGVRATPAVLAELGMSGLAGFSEGTLREEGKPGTGLLVGAGASMMGAPMAGTVGKVADGTANAVRAIRNMTPEALPYMDKIGVTKGALVRASGELKREVPDIPAYIEALKDAEKRTAGLPGNVDSRQVADNMPNARGGAGFAHMSQELSKTDKEYRRTAALGRADFLDYLSEQWDELVDVDPDFPEFLARYDEGQTDLKMAEREAWRLVRENEQPTFDLEDVIERAQDISQRSVYKRGDIPQVVRDLLDPDLTPSTKVNLDRFQELRSVLLGVARDAKIDPKSANKHAASMSSELLEMMGDKIDAWSDVDLTGKSLEYQRARTLTAENASLYDTDSPVILSLEKGGTPKSLFARLRSAQGKKEKRTTPAEEAARIVRIAEQTPGGLKNLRALAIEDLFFDGLNPTAVKTPAKKLESNEDMYRVVLGDTYDQAKDLLEISRLGTWGTAGAPGQVASVGSGISPAKFLFGLARSSRDPISSAVEGAMKMAGKETKSDFMWQAIVREAIQDKTFMRVLMEMPTERTLPAWKVQWSKLLRQAGTRSAARAEMRRQANNDG